MKMRQVLLFILTNLFCLLAPAQSIRLMTYNIRLDVASDGVNSWPNRKDGLLSQIRFHAPDVLGIQEALPHQVTEMQEQLPEYIHVGLGREENGTGEASSVFYNKYRFSLLESGTFWLSQTPDIVSRGWDAACNRVCTYVLLKDKKTNKIFWVFNTHLDHMGEIARDEGIQLIMQKIETLNTSKFPFFFMGDFNSTPDTSRIRELKTKLTDAKEASAEKPFGPEGTFNGFDYNKKVTDRIDYIFCSPNLGIKIKKYAVLAEPYDLKFPSDHFPVLTDIILN